MQGGRGFLLGLALSSALTLCALSVGMRAGLAQTPGQAPAKNATPAQPAPKASASPAAQVGQCSDFQRLSEDAGKKAQAVQAAMKVKAERKEICKLMTTFVAAETLVVKFLTDNQTWCAVPAQVVANSKTAHEHSMKFQTAACNENAPERKAPTLSDAIQTPKVDSAANTKTGKGGAFDTLMGNPLGK
jgi:hypothetical protein